MKQCLLLSLLVCGAASAAFAAEVPLVRPPNPPDSPLKRQYDRMPKREDIAKQFHLALLDPVLPKDPSPAERDLVDLVRSSIGQATTRLVRGLGLMTKESMVEILGPEKAANCEGQCAAATGKDVGADYIIDGRVRKTAAGLTQVELKLWESRTGFQLSNVLARGATDEALLANLETLLPKLFDPIILMLEAEIQAAQEQLRVRQQQALYDANLSSSERDAKARAAAEAREAQLEKQRLATEAIAKAEAMAAEETRRDERAAIPRRAVLRKVGWVLLGAGVIGGLVAGGSAIAATSKTNQIKNGDFSEVADLVTTSEQIPGLNQLSKVASIVGGALLVSGLGLVLFNQDPEGRGGMEVSLHPTGLLIAGKF